MTLKGRFKIRFLYRQVEEARRGEQDERSVSGCMHFTLEGGMGCMHRSQRKRALEEGAMAGCAMRFHTVDTVGGGGERCQQRASGQHCTCTLGTVRHTLYGTDTRLPHQGKALPFASALIVHHSPSPGLRPHDGMHG